MKKERIVYLDVLRVIACCMIVLMHSPHPDAGVPGFVQVPLYFVTAAGLCLFFMVSGALLLPVQAPTFEFLKKRMGKIIFPTLFWTMFYLVVRWLFDGVPGIEISKAVVSIPFSTQGHGVLWFMYALAGLYLLSPVISAFLKQATRQEVRFYLILWGITLIYPWLKGIVVTNESPTGILYYFAGFVGYFVLGYYLHTYKSMMHKMVSRLLITFPIILLAVYKFTGHEGWQSSGCFWYLSIFVAMMCVGWYTLIQKLCCCVSGGKLHILRILSNCCFGIYLVHIFVMRCVLRNIDFIAHGLGWIGQIVLTWSFTMLLSFAITYAISHLPYSEYIVGFRTKHVG